MNNIDDNLQIIIFFMSNSSTIQNNSLTTFYNLKSQNTCFQALKELKLANAQHQIIQKRVTVLKINDQRNVKKIQTQQNRIHQILQVRGERTKQKEKEEKIKISKIEEIEKKKSKHKEQKQEQKQKISQIKNTLSECRFKAYKKMCKKTQQNEDSIVRDKVENVEKNKKKRNKVLECEKISNECVLQFINKKTSTVHTNVAMERDSYLRKKVKKQKQISKVSELQLEMIKKSSESQIAYKETKLKLDAILGNIKSQNRKNKFNAIEPGKNRFSQNKKADKVF